MNTTTRPLQDTGQPLSTVESLSALCDGALDPDELGALMQNCQRDAQSLERWHAYQVIGAARTMLREAPLMSVLPGIAILLTVLAINLIGEGLNDAMNPQLRKRGE